MSFGELLVRLAAWAINTAFLGWLTLWVWRALRAHQTSINLVLLVFLAIFNTTAFTLLAGLVGLLSPAPIVAASIAGGGCLLAIPSARSTLRQTPGFLGSLRGKILAFWGSLPVWLRWLTIAAVIVTSARFAFLILVLPPFVWDSLTYHLTNVAHWVQAGRIELFNTPVVRIYTPANYEVLAAWFAVFLHHDVVIEAAGLPAYALAVVSVYAGARQLGGSRPAGVLAALAYGSTPALLLAVTGTKNDPHMAAYLLAALALLLYLVRQGQEDNPGPLLGPGISLVLILMLAAGTKTYLAYLLPALVVPALGIGSAIKGRPLWSKWVAGILKQLEAGKLRIRVGLMILVVTGVFVGGYWNVRNWVLTGNPFYPYGLAVEGSQVLPEGDRATLVGWGQLKKNISTLDSRFGDTAGPIRPDLPGTTGWGWFAYGLGLPVAAWALIRRPKFRPLALGFVLSFAALLTSTKVDPYNMRYMIWFPALFSYGFSLWADSLGSSTCTLRGLFWLMFVGCVGLNFTMTLNYNRVPIEQFQRMLATPWFDRASANLDLGMPEEYANAIRYVPEEALMGYDVHDNGFVYPLFRPDFSQRLVYVNVSPEMTCQQIVEEMRALGTRYLIVAPEHTSDEDLGKLNICERQGILPDRAPGVYVVDDEI